MSFLFLGLAVRHHRAECPKASKSNHTGYFLIRMYQQRTLIHDLLFLPISTMESRMS